MTGLIYQTLPEGTLYFAPRAISQMLSHRQTSRSSREAGGVLLGRYLEGGEDIVVDTVTEPMLGDRRSWAGFFRSVRHGFSARRRWAKHNQTSAYLGSWHTHPETNPRPSTVDTTDWHRALAIDIYEGSRLFFVIVGTKQLRVWQGDRHGDLIELRLIGEQHEEDE